MKAKTEILIKRAAAELKTADAREIYVFGSAAKGTGDAASDLDLAVSGLPPSVFYRMGARVSDLIPQRERKWPFNSRQIFGLTPFRASQNIFCIVRSDPAPAKSCHSDEDAFVCDFLLGATISVTWILRITGWP
jgi:hypothetical protein